MIFFYLLLCLAAGFCLLWFSFNRLNCIIDCEIEISEIIEGLQFQRIFLKILFAQFQYYFFSKLLKKIFTWVVGGCISKQNKYEIFRLFFKLPELIFQDIPKHYKDRFLKSGQKEKKLKIRKI